MRRRAGTVTDAVARDGPGSAERHFAPRRVRDKCLPNRPIGECLRILRVLFGHSFSRTAIASINFPSPFRLRAGLGPQL
jgi:hypothetical protein